MRLLPLHIIGGVVGVVAGFIALFALKGAKLHRKSGMVFVYAIVTLSLTGVVMATLKYQPGSIIGGALTFYLVTTGLLTVRRRDHEFHSTDAAATQVAIAVGLFATKLGFDAVNSATGKTDGGPLAALFIFAAVALLAAAGDIRMMFGWRAQGAHRIARHLWRMCFAMLIVSFSFFIGKAKVFPKPIRTFPVLSIPVVVVLVLMLYWLARVLFTQWYRRRPYDSFKSAALSSSA